MARKGGVDRRTKRILDFDQHIDSMIDGLGEVTALLEQMDMFDRYTDTIELNMSAAVAENFHDRLDDVAANTSGDPTKSFMHLYKWGADYEDEFNDESRLVHLVFAPDGSGYHGFINFLEDHSGGRSIDENGEPYYTDHLMVNHAEVMEHYGAANVVPLEEGGSLAYKVAGGSNIIYSQFSRVSYERQRGTLHDFFVQYFTGGAVEVPMREVVSELNDAHESMLNSLAGAIDYKIKPTTAGSFTGGGFKYNNKTYTMADFEKATRRGGAQAKRAINAFMSHMASRNHELVAQLGVEV